MKFTLDDFDTSLIAFSAATGLGTGLHASGAPEHFQARMNSIAFRISVLLYFYVLIFMLEG